MFYYSTQFELKIGQLVIVNLQNQLLDGVVFGENKTENQVVGELSLEIEKIKNIESCQPFILKKDQIQFLRFLINNTFNNSGTVLASFLQPLKILNQKHWQALYFQNQYFPEIILLNKNTQNEILNENLKINLKSSENKPSQNWKKNLDQKSFETKAIEKIKNASSINDNNLETLNNLNEIILDSKNTIKQLFNNEKPEVNFWLEEDFALRIMYIIRNLQEKYHQISKKLNKEIQSKNDLNNSKTDCKFQKISENLTENIETKTKKSNFIENSTVQKTSLKKRHSEEILKNGKKIENSEKNSFYSFTINDKKIVFEIVIIFPENKLIDKIWQDLLESPIWQSLLGKVKTQNWVLENYFWTSKINQQSRKTILELLNLEIEKKTTSKTTSKLGNKKIEKQKISEKKINQNYQNLETQNKIKTQSKNWKSIKTQNLNENLENENPEILENKYKLRIIWGTRSALFLPFNNLVQVILIDEANSFHIQEQNSLYFDSREAVFLLHKSTNSHLDFVSKLPSVRFKNFYQKDNLQKKPISKTQKNESKFNQKIQLKITTSPQKYYNNNLFSHQIEQILQKKENIYFGEED